MAMDPMTMTAIAGAISGLFGSKPKYSPMQKLQMGVANDLMSYSKGVAGSDPQERALLGSLNAQLGAGQRQARDLLYAGMPAMARTDTTDMALNLGSREMAQRGNLNLQALMQFLANRKAAGLQAAGVAGGVGAPQQQGGGEALPAMFGQLASLYAQKQSMKDLDRIFNKRDAGAGTQSVKTPGALGAGAGAGGGTLGWGMPLPRPAATEAQGLPPGVVDILMRGVG